MAATLIPGETRGFVFTIDSMFALAALSLLALVYLLVSSSHLEIQKYSSLEDQGRDFLRLNNRENVPIDGSRFQSLTFHRMYLALGNLTFKFGSASDVSAFTPRNGTWAWSATSGGVYIQSNADGAAGKTSFQSYLNLPSSDYLFEAKLNYSNQGSARWVGGISIRSNSSGARYLCVLAGNSKLELWRLQQWNSTDADLSFLLDDKTISTPDDKTFRVWLKAAGNSLECGTDNLDDANPPVVISRSDNAFNYGFPALEAYAYAAPNNFDDVLLSGAAPNASLLLRSVLYQYPLPCGCAYNPASPVCVVQRTNACLAFQESLNSTLKEVWIS